MSRLRKKLRAVADDYRRQCCVLLGYKYENTYWIGYDDVSEVIDVCDFGGTTFLTFDQMQTIVDNLEKWVLYYGSCDGVSRRVHEWIKWSSDEKNMTKYGTPKINLRHWLLGASDDPCVMQRGIRL